MDYPICEEELNGAQYNGYLILARPMVGNMGPHAVTSEILPLTSSRFIAAFAVILYHTAFPFVPGLSAVPMFSAIVEHGNSAVDFFFALSGYILTLTYSPRTYDKTSFFVARFARVYPVYAFALLVDLPFFIFFRHSRDGADAWSRIAVTVAAYIPLLQAWLVMIGKVWCLPGWSLSCEAFFYAVFPFIEPRRKQISLFEFSVLSWIMISIAVSYASPRIDNPNIRLMLSWNPLLHLPSFLLGIACVELTEARKRMLWLLGSVSFIAMWFSPSVQPIPLFGLAILALHGLSTGTIMSSRLMVLLGRASYAMYLLHWPIWRLFGFFGHREHELEYRGDSPALWICYLVTVILASIAVHHWVENPARQFITTYWKQRQLKTAFAADPGTR